MDFSFGYTPHSWEFGIGFYKGRWSAPPAEHPWAFYLRHEICLMVGPFSFMILFGKDLDEEWSDSL